MARSRNPGGMAAWRGGGAAGTNSQANAAQVSQEAAVALLDRGTGKALAGGSTGDAGAFTLAPDSSFIPAPAEFYYLQVSRRAAPGSNQVSMITVVRWTAGGWASLTSGSPGAGEIVVNPTTTAVTLLALESGADFGTALGKVLAPGYSAAETFGSVSADQVAARATAIAAALAADVDPVGDRPRVAGNLAPDDTGDPRVHHDYLVTRGGMTSAFVWVPVFTAYQLIDPTAAGHTGKPVGYWVKDPPGSGTENVDWARETFGGFYAAKYEASRDNAKPGDPATGAGADAGTNATLKVQQYCVPWTNITWDAAARAALAYHPPYSHLMRDDEWTALAVWSMIWDKTVYGNNNYCKDVDNDTVTFLRDQTHPNNGRALTGTGTCSTCDPAWSDTNLTTHTGTTAGVYDLNGNVHEWTGSLGAASGGNYVLDDVDTGVNVGQGAISQIATDPWLRRHGLPGTVAGSGAPPLLHGDWLYKNPSATTKAMRGFERTGGTRAGIWAINFSARGDRDETVGFRPALRF